MNRNIYGPSMPSQGLGRQGAISAVLNEEDLAKNPEQIFKNTKRL